MGIYCSKNEHQWTIYNLQEDGHPICVIDEEGKIYHFKVGITEYTSNYEATLDKEIK